MINTAQTCSICSCKSSSCSFSCGITALKVLKLKKNKTLSVLSKHLFLFQTPFPEKLAQPHVLDSGLCQLCAAQRAWLPDKRQYKTYSG